MTEQPSEVPFAFFGTPKVARDTLASLLAAGYRPQVVITSPDARRGRGLASAPCETKEYAEAERLPVLTPETLDEEFISGLRSRGLAYAIVVAYGKIFPQELIDAFPQGVLNVHYSLLPRYRGASPVETALLNGETETGVTVQRMVARMDAGDIIAQLRTPIDVAETARELRARLVTLGAELLIGALPAYLDGSSVPVPQDHGEATFARKIAKADGELQPSDSSESKWRKYRAYAESPGTYFYAEKEGSRIRVKVAEAAFTDGAFVVKRIVPEGKGVQDFSWLEKSGWQPTL